MSIPVFSHRFYLYIHPVTQVFIKIGKYTWNSDLCATVTIKWTHRKKQQLSAGGQENKHNNRHLWKQRWHERMLFILCWICSCVIPSHCTKRPINENASLGIFKNKHPVTTWVPRWLQCHVQMQGYEYVGPGAERNRNEIKVLIPCDVATFDDFVPSVWMTLGWIKVRVC